MTAGRLAAKHRMLRRVTEGNDLMMTLTRSSGANLYLFAKVKKGKIHLLATIVIRGLYG